MVNTATESVETQPDIAVKLTDVSKVYGEEPIAISALDHATLSVPKGEFVVLLGPSGSGKTTLLNVVGGIEPPTSGQIFVNSIDVSALGGSDLAAYRREQLGFVFQFFNLIPTLTALENVELIAELTGSSSGDRSRHMLHQVGLGERMDYFPGTLSGGEQQRVAVARALVKRPSVLLCDEPTGALDLETGRQVLGLLHRVNREQSITILLVTHNSAIAEMADRVVRMRSGKIIDAIRVESPVPAEDVTW